MIKFKLNANNVNNLISLIKELDLQSLWDVNIKPFKHTRSLDQNERYWKMITEIGNHIGYEKDEMHELMAYKFLSEEKKIGNDDIVKIKSTSSLTTKEMSEYQDRIESWAIDYGFRFNDE